MQKQRGIIELKPGEKDNLSEVCAKKYKIPFSQKAAFDLVKVDRQKKVDFGNKEDIERNVEAITIVEVKSTNRKELPDDFKGYFFSLSTAELLLAQNLKEHFKFAFVNTVRSSWRIAEIRDILGSVHAIYPTWSIRLDSLSKR